MAKFYGAIGYGKTEEVSPGVWKLNITERNIYGDLIKNTRRLENSGKVNDNIIINNQVSFLADPYARDNFHNIKYAKFMGTSWKVTSVDVEYPRLILNLGGEFNVDEE
jgi:hypothetical protein